MLPRKTMKTDDTDLQIVIDKTSDQSLPQSSSEPSPLNFQTGQLIPSSSRPPTIRTHVSGSTATANGIDQSLPHRADKDDTCWGWLEPAPECSRHALPHVMLRGNIIGIGRGADAFDLAMQTAKKGLQSAGSSSSSGGGGQASFSNIIREISLPAPPGATDEAIFDTGSGMLPQVPGLCVEIPDGRVSRVHCLLSTTSSFSATATAVEAMTASTSSATNTNSSVYYSYIPILRDISRNGTFLNGRKLSRGEEARLSEGDRISLVLSVAPLAEQAFIFHLGHPLGALLNGPPPTQWIGWKGRSFTERERIIVAPGGKDESLVSSPTSPASLGSASPKSFPPSAAAPALRSSSSSSFPSSPTVPQSSPSSSTFHLPRVTSYKAAMKRSATSVYTTPEVALAEPSTLQCQICLDTLRNAVALEPCGHSYCATCLSQHFGACLQHGQALTCPLRCSLPQRVVVNVAVRQLVEKLEQLEKEEENETLVEEENDGEGENVSIGEEVALVEKTTAAAPSSSSSSSSSSSLMHPVAPLDDSNLPLSLASLKDDKIVSLLNVLSQATAVLSTINTPALEVQPDVTPIVKALETLARLAWSDEEARGVVTAHNGVETIIKCIKTWIESEVVLCSGCLAVMAMIRGDGPASSANRWQLGMCGGLEILINAMKIHKNQSMVQLSALLCLAPLALEGAYFQEEISKIGLKTIVSAIKTHMDCEEVVAKALLTAGALCQGGGGGGGSGGISIADRLVASGLLEMISRVLTTYGGRSEDVLWACLFVLAVLARQNEVDNGGNGSGESENGKRLQIERMLRMASVGVLHPLRRAVAEYRFIYCDINTTTNTANYSVEQNSNATGQEEEMIIVAAAFLDQALERASELLTLRRLRRVSQAVAAGVLLWMGYTSYTSYYKHQRSQSSSAGRSGTATRGATHPRGFSSRYDGTVPAVSRRYFPWFVFKW
jgi:FHA domain/RING-type zinc-finger